MSTDHTPMIVLGVTLARLLGGGLVYRFYHTPASTGSNVVVVPAAAGAFGQLAREVVDATQAGVGAAAVITVPLVADLLAEADVSVTGDGASGSSPGVVEPAPFPE